MVDYKDFLLSKSEEDFKRILNPYFEQSGNFFQSENYIRDFYKVILKYFHFMVFEEFVNVNPDIDSNLYKEERLKIIKQNLYVNDFHQISSKIGDKRACTSKDVKASYSVLQKIFTHEKLVSYLFTFEYKDQLSKFNSSESIKQSDEYREAKQLEELEQWKLEKEFGIKLKPISVIKNNEIPAEFLVIYERLNRQKLEYDLLSGSIYDGMNYHYENRIYRQMEDVAEGMLTIFQEHTFSYGEEKINLLLDFLFLKDEFLYSDVVYSQMNNRTKFENIMYVDLDIRNLKRIEAEKNSHYSNIFKRIFASATYRQKPILDKKFEEERQRRKAADRAYRMRYEL